MKKQYILLVCCFSLTSFSSVYADPGSLSVGAKAGTLGLGGEVGLGVSEQLALRGGANSLAFSFDTTISHVDYEMEPELKNLSFLLDWHPFTNSFRITGGLFINDNSIAITGKPDLDYYLKDVTIPGEYQGLVDDLSENAKISGAADMNTLAPYVGIGWNSNSQHEQGWGVSIDLGVMFMGSPALSELTLSTTYKEEEYKISSSELDELESERKELQDELDKFEYYPVGTIMIHYTF